MYTKIITIISLLLLTSCNHVSNKIITDEKTGKPMLVGKTDINTFQKIEFSEWYNTEYYNYEPDNFIIEQNKLFLDSIKIEIFMGTWCSDSRREVPRFIKILNLLEYNMDDLQIINLDRKKHSPNNEEKERNIDFVPTFIFSKDNIELGRIVEFPIVTLESDLLNILMGIN